MSRVVHERLIDPTQRQLRDDRPRATLGSMAPEEIRALRTRLKATAKELAHVLGIEPAIIGAWERGELFPTKRHVERLAELDRAGSAAVPKIAPKNARPRDPMSGLADPALWTLIRKLLVHPDLRAATAKLAEPYEDPAPPA